MKKAWICVILTLILLTAGVAYAQKWKQVAVLASDVEKTETALVVDSGTQIVVDKDVMIESRDGKIKENYKVKSVYENVVLLRDKLKQSFDAGSRLYQ